MTQLNPKKTALAIGISLASFHVLWSFLVLVGFAQPLLDFIFWLHMIRAVYLVDAFNLVAALCLILVTFLMGGGVGFAFAKIWNWLHRG